MLLWLLVSSLALFQKDVLAASASQFAALMVENQSALNARFAETRKHYLSRQVESKILTINIHNSLKRVDTDEGEQTVVALSIESKNPLLTGREFKKSSSDRWMGLNSQWAVTSPKVGKPRSTRLFLALSVYPSEWMKETWLEKIREKKIVDGVVTLITYWKMKPLEPAVSRERRDVALPQLWHEIRLELEGVVFRSVYSGLGSRLGRARK